MKRRTLWTLVRRTVSEWRQDRAQRLGASLAYYTVFSLPPLLLVAVWLVSWVFHGDAIARIEAQLAALVSDDAAHTIAEAIRATRQSVGGGWLATSLGVAAMLLGATGVFAQLQDAMNTIWEVEPAEGRGVLGVIFDRFLSFGMVLAIGFLLLVSLLVSAAIAAFSGYVGDRFPGVAVLAQGLEVAASFLLITTLFALIFKFLPDADTAWRDVMIGAAVTAALFEVGKFGIGFYLGRGHVGSAYGAASVVVVLLIWVYYSAQILFLGAEFTQVYASIRGEGVVVDPDAKPVTERRRAQQGMAADAPGEPRRKLARPRGGLAAPILSFVGLLAVLMAARRRRR